MKTLRLKTLLRLVCSNLLSMFFIIPVFAQDTFIESYWVDTDKREITTRFEMEKYETEKISTIQINSDRLFDELETSLSRQKIGEKVIVELPTPENNSILFEIEHHTLMHPELAAKYPQIKAYQGLKVGDPSISTIFTITPKGLHAVVNDLQKGKYYIDPVSVSNKDNYVIYTKKDIENPGFKCSEAGRIDRPGTDDPPLAAGPVGDGKIRQYDLAMACTGEFTAYHGGTVMDGMSAIAATLARVNEIYQKEFTITFWLVFNNDMLIYTDPSTDPYTSGNTTALIAENQANVDLVIGNSVYDIGHVLDQGANNGRGLIGGLCNSTIKGSGCTIHVAPTGDPFNVDYVSHEMGHQCGGMHSFYSTDPGCQGPMVDDRAFEPGSGSSIMSYAGICPANSNNVQMNADPYFHVASLKDVKAIVEGTNCSAISANSVVKETTALALADVSLPKATTFVLIGAGSAGTGAPSHQNVWEQVDGRPSGTPYTVMPPLASNDHGPAFRSEIPTFWGLSRVFGNTAAEPMNTWEVVPSPTTVDRELNFNYTVRHVEGLYGRSAYDDKKVTILHDAGPFVITSAIGTVGPGDMITVNWDVANTDQAPLNIDRVGIYINVDNVWSDYLAVPTDNDGTETVTIPAAIPPGTATITVRNYTPLWSSAGVTGVLFLDYSNSFTVTSFAGDADDRALSETASLVKFDGTPYELENLIINKGIQSFTVSEDGAFWIDKEVLKLVKEELQDTETETFLEVDDEIVAAPNPSNNVSTITSKHHLIKHIFVYDLSGKLVRVYDHLNEQQFDLKKSEIGTGLFIAKIHFKENVVLKKIIFN